MGRTAFRASHTPKQPIPPPGIASAYDPRSSPGQAGLGRLGSSSTNISGVTRTLGYGYDRNGARIRITHPDGVQFTASFDGLGRQTWIHEQGVIGRVVAGYNSWGSLAGTSRSNLTLTNYGYDGVQRPNAYYHDLGGTAADGLWTFARNPAGQIGSATRENAAYALDGRLHRQPPLHGQRAQPIRQDGTARCARQRRVNLRRQPEAKDDD